jgi:sugar phosphate isomerase/epimerase
MNITRRTMLQSTLGGAIVAAAPVWADEKKKHMDVTGQLGITTGSFMRHLSVDARKGKIRLLDVPQVMRDELDLRVIDLMTATMVSQQPAYLDELRARADKAGCTLTNLKMNQKGLDMASPDPATRGKALDEYKRTIDSAERLGCRWVRPIPLSAKPDLKLYAASYRELIDYAAPKGITLLVENFGWLSADPEAIPQVIKAVGPGLHASPDTGNWTDQARYEGLAKAYPLAATSDFKALMFNADGKHPRYDLQRCFQIGWDAGFRGPWCFEHFDESLEGLLKGFARLRDLLRGWIQEAA